MAYTDYLPKRQDQLLAFARNVAAKFADPAFNWGITPDQKLKLDNRLATFENRMAALDDPMTKSPGNVALKNVARASLVEHLRNILQFVRNNPATSAIMLEELGLSPRKTHPTPVPPPTSIPGVEVLSGYGSMLYVRLFDPASPTRRRRPDGVATTTVMWASGPARPTSAAEWQFLLTTSKTTLSADFPATLPAGTTVWLSAFFSNAKGQNGPACLPVSTNLPGGASTVAAAEPAPMRIAA